MLNSEIGHNTNISYFFKTRLVLVRGTLVLRQKYHSVKPEYSYARCFAADVTVRGQRVLCVTTVL